MWTPKTGSCKVNSVKFKVAPDQGIETNFIIGRE